MVVVAERNEEDGHGGGQEDRQAGEERNNIPGLKDTWERGGCRWMASPTIQAAGEEAGGRAEDGSKRWLRVYRCPAGRTKSRNKKQKRALFACERRYDRFSHLRFRVVSLLLLPLVLLLLLPR